jgi:hypothetical protein
MKNRCRFRARKGSTRCAAYRLLDLGTAAPGICRRLGCGLAGGAEAGAAGAGAATSAGVTVTGCGCWVAGGGGGVGRAGGGMVGCAAANKAPRISSPSCPRPARRSGKHQPASASCSLAGLSAAGGPCCGGRGGNESKGLLTCGERRLRQARRTTALRSQLLRQRSSSISARQTGEETRSGWAFGGDETGRRRSR